MFTKITEKTLDDALRSLGLSTHAQKIYKVLIEKGKQRAKMIAHISLVRRELCYRALEELETQGLVKKNDPEEGVALFEPVHPEILIKRLKENNAEVTAIENTLASNISELTNVYKKAVGLPYVESFEGVAGISHLYKDINASETELIKLFRSPLDITHKDIKELISNQREYQKKNKIHTKMVTSFTYPSLKASVARDKEYFTERKIVPHNVLKIPAQIILYGEKVAITSYDGALITTIIENKAIHTTFDILFTILWDSGKTVQEMLKKEVSFE